MTKSPEPARLTFFMARDEPYSLILRRGPTRFVCSIGWDRRDDTFQLGQWFRGRIYEERCDLSPDGQHFVYFAAKHEQFNTSNRGTWTAISRTPYLKALCLWPKGGTWEARSLFLNNRTISLSGYYNDPLVHDDRFEAVTLLTEYYRKNPHETYTQPKGVTVVDSYLSYVREDEQDFLDDLKNWRYGWRLDNEGRNPPVTHRVGKQVTKHWWLLQGSCNSPYCLFAERGSKTIEFPQGTTWADCDTFGDRSKIPQSVRIFYARKGQLFAATLSKDGLGEASTLYDFNGMAVEQIEAPY